MEKNDIIGIKERYTAKVRCQHLLGLSEEVWNRKLQPGKAYPDVKIRWFVSYEMRKEGYSYSEIGRAMGRHYASVINHVKCMSNVFDEPIFYAEENEKFSRFSDMVAELDSE